MVLYYTLFELLVNSFLLRRVIFLDLVTVAWYSHNERRFKMDFIEKAKFLMKRYGLNKRSLSQKSEIPYTTIDNWV